MGEAAPDRCEIAWSVLVDLISAECTPEKLGILMKKLLGLKDDEVNPSEKCKLVLETFQDPEKRKEICKDFRGYRRVVMCKAFELLEKGEVAGFSDAMDKAWDWVKEKCAEVGVFI